MEKKQAIEEKDFWQQRKEKIAKQKEEENKLIKARKERLEEKKLLKEKAIQERIKNILNPSIKNKLILWNIAKSNKKSTYKGHYNKELLFIIEPSFLSFKLHIKSEKLINEIIRKQEEKLKKEQKEKLPQIDLKKHMPPISSINLYTLQVNAEKILKENLSLFVD